MLFSLCSIQNAVIVTVSNEPIANDDYATTNEGTPVNIPVLANDSDSEGGTPTVTATSGGPSNGAASVNADGTIRYTPSPGFSGTDTFEYTVADWGGATATATGEY